MYFHAWPRKGLETELSPEQRNVVQSLLKYTTCSLAGKANGALHNQEVHG